MFNGVFGYTLKLEMQWILGLGRMNYLIALYPSYLIFNRTPSFKVLRVPVYARV